MADHVSSLQLDTLAAGLPVDAAVPAHVQSCAECQAKLDAAKAARAAVLRSPQFEATLAKLQPAPVQQRPRWLAPVLAFAAALLVLVIGSRFVRPADDTLLKGAQTVELLRDGAPVTQAKVGEKLTLAVGAGGQSAVAVFTLDGKGEVEVLLPSTPVAKGARVPVGNQLEVTAGSLAVFACFGADPLKTDALRAEVFARAVDAKANPLDAKPPDGCAKARLEVLP